MFNLNVIATNRYSAKYVFKTFKLYLMKYIFNSTVFFFSMFPNFQIFDGLIYTNFSRTLWSMLSKDLIFK